jgi:hypothetical protein
MAESEPRPAFYAARPGGWRDWWTILHPPYTSWHLAYVVLGATLAPRTDVVRLVGALLAFFLAVGVSAHVFDELHGRPLGTHVGDRTLWTTGVTSLAGAVAIGFAGVGRVGLGLVVFIAVGPLLVLGYNLELFGGRLHNDLVFAATWGAFPVLTAYYAQVDRLDLTAVAGAAAAFAFSFAQRCLSTPARLLRRRVDHVEGALHMADGSVRALDRARLLDPLEQALRTLSGAMVVLAIALALARTT